MSRTALQLELLPEVFSVVQLAPDSGVPDWADAKTFCSVTRTPDELSLVVPADLVPEGTVAEKGWKCLRVKGKLDFDLTGVLAELSTSLARESISLFVVSTFNTDYLFVKAASLRESLQVLKSSGYAILPAPSC